MSALIGLMFSIAVSLLISGIRRIRTPGYEAQMAQFGPARGDDRPRTRYERWVRPWALRLADAVGVLRILTNPEKVARQLDYAGNPGRVTAHELYGVQIYGLLVGLIIGMLWAFLGLPFGAPILIFLPIFGFFYPSMWLRGKVRRRQHEITIALPDLIDMLAVCVTSGMGFDVALKLLTERGEGPLYEEMDRLLRELSIGEPREQAFRHMVDRNSSEELRSFVDALLQADELGTPIAATLERQAEDMRIRRQQRGREKGAQASNKLALVLSMLIAPSVMCMIIAGLVLSFSQTGGGELLSTSTP